MKSFIFQKSVILVYSNAVNVLKLSKNMDTAKHNNTLMLPQPYSELLPGIKAILSEETTLLFTTKKKPGSAIDRTTIKQNDYKPLTLSEIKAITAPTPAKCSQASTSKSKPWKSSVKVNKTKNLTTNREHKFATVRKTLTFQPKQQRQTTNSRTTMVNSPQRKTNIHTLQSEKTTLSLTNKKKPSSTTDHTRIKENNFKPLTLAELQAITAPTPAKCSQTSTLKSKPWNSSVKVNKTKDFTTNREQKFATVRKTLTFQPKIQRQTTNSRVTMVNSPQKKTNVQAKTSDLCNISGVCKISKTPVIQRLLKSRMPDIDITNVSLKSNSDASFLQREKEICDLVEKSNDLAEEPTLERIAEVSPPVSTPFTEYRNVHDYFNSTLDADSANDKTIVNFDKSPTTKEETNKRDETLILFEMLNKTTISNNDINNINNDVLLERLIEMENDVMYIDKITAMLNSIKKKKLKSIEKVKVLALQVQKPISTTTNNEICIVNDTNIQNEMVMVKEEKHTPEKSSMRRDTVIKKLTPTYKIPRRLSLRKKVFSKCVPNIPNDTPTPNNNNDVALDMYMQIKEQMTFLYTPLKNKHFNETPETPATSTSYNLQKQLDKLYNEM